MLAPPVSVFEVGVGWVPSAAVLATRPPSKLVTVASVEVYLCDADEVVEWTAWLVVDGDVKVDSVPVEVNESTVGADKADTL